MRLQLPTIVDSFADSSPVLRLVDAICLENGTAKTVFLAVFMPITDRLEGYLGGWRTSIDQVITKGQSSGLPQGFNFFSYLSESLCRKCGSSGLECAI
jgi:hypothetical protein